MTPKAYISKYIQKVIGTKLFIETKRKKIRKKLPKTIKGSKNCMVHEKMRIKNTKLAFLGIFAKKRLTLFPQTKIIVCIGFVAILHCSSIWILYYLRFDVACKCIKLKTMSLSFMFIFLLIACIWQTAWAVYDGAEKYASFLITEKGWENSQK